MIASRRSFLCLLQLEPLLGTIEFQDCDGQRPAAPREEGTHYLSYVTKSPFGNNVSWTEKNRPLSCYPQHSGDYVYPRKHPNRLPNNDQFAYSGLRILMPYLGYGKFLPDIYVKLTMSRPGFHIFPGLWGRTLRGGRALPLLCYEIPLWENGSLTEKMREPIFP